MVVERRAMRYGVGHDRRITLPASGRSSHLSGRDGERAGEGGRGPGEGVLLLGLAQVFLALGCHCEGAPLWRAAEAPAWGLGDDQDIWPPAEARGGDVGRRKDLSRINWKVCFVTDNLSIRSPHGPGDLRAVTWAVREA